MSAPSFTSFPTLPAPDTASSSKLSDVSKKGGNDQSAKRTSSSIPPHEKSIKRKRSRLARDVVGYEGDGSDFHAASPATSHGRGSRYSRSSHREISTGIRTTHHELGVDRYAAGTSRSEWHYTDIVGDKEAHLYGPTTSSSCPHYRRDQNGRVLGLPGQLRSTKTGEKSSPGIEIAKLGQPYIPRYSNRTRQEEEHLRFRIESTAFDPSAGFIGVDSRSRRSTEAKNIDIPADYDTHDAIDVARERIQTFETHIKSHPEDTTAWISYSQAHISSEDGVQRTAQLEISLSILTRGLQGLSWTKSIPLHLEYMRVAAEVWPHARVEHTWRLLLEEVEAMPTMGHESFEIWLGHFKWSEGPGFGRDGRDVDSVIELYERRLHDISKYGFDQSECEEKQMYLFTRACGFLSAAGYQERATAAFQAMLDISLSIADGSLTLSQDFRNVLRDYEDFWDSGWLRLGEDGAEGWQFANKPSPATSSSAVPTTDLGADAYHQWYIAENQAGLCTRPTRSHEANTTTSDPYEVVLFDDIRSLMFPIRTLNSFNRLVAAFLRHQGVGEVLPDNCTSSPIYQDPRMLPIDTDAPFWPLPSPRKERPWELIAGEAMEPIRRSNLTDMTSGPVRCWSVTRNTLLGVDWFSDLDPVTVTRSDVTMMRNVIGLCRDRLPGPLFDLISVALEDAVSPRRAVKHTKETLAREPDNITVWAGHARLEIKRGRLEAARAVYAGVLAQQSDAFAGDNSPALAMWADWAMMEWANGDQARCSEVLVALAHSRLPERLLGVSDRPQKPSSLAMLKTRKFYSTRNLPVDLSWLTLSALFHYQDSFESAARLLQENANACAAESFEREQTLQLLIEIHHRHSTWHPGPKAAVRNLLNSAIQEFPNNTQFLSTALWHHLQSGLRAPVNDLISRLTEPEGSLNSILWSVWAEGMSAIDLYAPGCGGAARVRATLRRALASHVGRDCPVLWLRAIEFERLMGRPEAAKSLFYRAMGQVGSIKRLYMVPFHEDLRKMFTDAELSHIVEAMSTRGIRLRCEPVDFALPLEAGDVLPSDEELEDDELKFLRDAQANKPY